MENSQKTFAELLAPVRDEIDAIDKQLLPLFIERMKCSKKVADIKIANNIPVLNPEREKIILDRVRAEAGEEFGASAADLYASIMSISRAYQHKFTDTEDADLTRLVTEAEANDIDSSKKILCQGVEGAYSNIAAKRFFGKDADINFCPQFADVFTAIKEGKADYGVVPVENSAVGSVSDVYSLIMKYKYYIVGAVNVPVRHCLAAKKGSDIKTVYSHSQALGQCKGYIARHDYKAVQYSNTAAAAKFVANSDDYSIAAICSEDAAEKYGLEIIENGIQDASKNNTRFAVISKEPAIPENAEKISLILSVPNVPGSLFQLLERFALKGLDLTKIESRPIKNSDFDYEFYLDFKGNVRDKDVFVLLSSLAEELKSFTFLGNYREI